MKKSSKSNTSFDRRKLLLGGAVAGSSLAFASSASANVGFSSKPENRSSLIPGEDFERFSIDKDTPIIVDSFMSFEDAVGDSKVSSDVKKFHLEIKPYLHLAHVFYHGYDGELHFGQFVIHRQLVESLYEAFKKMLELKFPVQQAIPGSYFNYDDEASMQKNNSSCYRPEILNAATGKKSEHFKATAIDINTFTNPMDVTNEDGTRTISPAGAHYDATAKGALVKESDVRKFWVNLKYEWGGNWGDPQADPSRQFYKEGFFDYQHFQFENMADIELPSGW